MQYYQVIFTTSNQMIHTSNNLEYEKSYIF